MSTQFPYRIYESQYVGEQTAPLGFWGNDFGGNIYSPVLENYTVVGYTEGRLWLRSKTGDASDSIQINFHVDVNTFERVFANKKACFAGKLEWDYAARAHFYQWTCTKIDR